MVDFSKLEKILDNGEQYGSGPGCGCIVYYKHQPVFRYLSGFRDKKQKLPLQGDELYNLYSCSKVMTCTTAMLLWERGKFNLDDEVGKYIPEFYNVTVAGEALERPVLVRHLFTMSAGLNYCLDDEVVHIAQKETEGHCPTVEMIRYLAKRPLDFQPGECFQYSLCHDVLGALIELWSGMSFYTFIKKEILDPLGMTSTFFILTPEEQTRKATLYRYNEEEKCGKRCEQSNPFVFGDEYESGGAGVISSLDDYGKFAEMLCNNGVTPDGRRIIKQETLDFMATAVFDNAFQESFRENVSWSRGYDYGLGVYVLANKEDANSTASLGTFGWDGAAGAYVSVDRENELAIFYVQHMYGGTAHVYHDMVRNAVYEAFRIGDSV